MHADNNMTYAGTSHAPMLRHDIDDSDMLCDTLVCEAFIYTASQSRFGTAFTSQ